MLERLNASLQLITWQTKANLHTLSLILAIIWAVFFLSRLDKRILHLGIVPRTWHGLTGIVFAPFLHANFNHIFFNSIPLVVLSNFLLMNGWNYYKWVTIEIALGSGLLIWCFARPAIYMGASAIISGYWALLVSNIVHQGTVTAFILGIVCLYYFVGIFMGIFPGKKGVSWEGHLFGLIVGFALSYL